MGQRAQLLRAWSGPLPPGGRLPKHYRLEVVSEETVCEVCGVGLRRQRSSTHSPRGIVLGQPRVCFIESP